MSVLPKTSVHATSITTMSLSVGDMPPCKVTSKELSEASTDETSKVTRPNVSIYADTQCFIDKGTQVNWRKINNTFMQDRFPGDVEYLHGYINIKKSKMHRITCRFSVIPCAKVIE